MVPNFLMTFHTQKMTFWLFQKEKKNRIIIFYFFVGGGGRESLKLVCAKLKRKAEKHPKRSPLWIRVASLSGRPYTKFQVKTCQTSKLFLKRDSVRNLQHLWNRPELPLRWAMKHDSWQHCYGWSELMKASLSLSSSSHWWLDGWGFFFFPLCSTDSSIKKRLPRGIFSLFFSLCSSTRHQIGESRFVIWETQLEDNSMLLQLFFFLFWWWEKKK